MTLPQPSGTQQQQQLNTPTSNVQNLNTPLSNSGGINNSSGGGGITPQSSSSSSSSQQQHSQSSSTSQQSSDIIDSFLKQQSEQLTTILNNNILASINNNLNLINSRNNSESEIFLVLDHCKQKINQIILSNISVSVALKTKLFFFIVNFQNSILKTFTNTSLKEAELLQKFYVWKNVSTYLKDHLLYFSKWKEFLYLGIQAMNSYPLIHPAIQKLCFEDTLDFFKLLVSFSHLEYPVYTILKEIKLFNSHACLEFQELVIPFYNRANRLSNLLTLRGLPDTFRLVGTTISLNQDIMIPYTSQLTESPPFFTTNKPLNEKYSVIVSHMLSQGAGVDSIKEFLFPQVQSNTLRSKIINIITEAAILRTVQLLHKYENNTNESNKYQIITQSWKEWVAFSDQFFSLVEENLLDFEQFIMLLQNKRMLSGKPIKDNIVIYLLSKTISNETKVMFNLDLQKVNGNHLGFLIPSILSFLNESQFNDPYLITQNISMHFFLMRILTIIEGSQDSIIPQYIKRLLEQQPQAFYPHKNKWEIEKSKPRMEFFSSNEDSTLISVVSNFFPFEVESELMKFQTSGENGVFSNGEHIIGKLKPVSHQLLFNLSSRCKKKIIESVVKNLEKEILLSPGILEDYNRLIHFTPMSLMPMFNYLKKFEKPTSVHTVIELFSNRLFKFIKANKELPILLKVTQEISTRIIPNYQLSRSVDYLILKSIQYLHFDVITTVKDLFKNLNFGSSIFNRRLIYSFARLIKNRGLSDFNKLQNIHLLIDSTYKQHPYVFSPNTLQYFPDMIKNEYSKYPPHSKTSILQKVLAENNAKQSMFSNPQKLNPQNKAQFFLFYQSDVSNSNLLFCQIFLYIFENKIQTEILSLFLQQFLYSSQSGQHLITNQIINKISSFLIDFILDEVFPYTLQQQQQQPFDYCKKTSDILCQWIFKYRILSLNSILILLCDRDDNPNSLQILSLILLDSQELNNRISYFQNDMLINSPKGSGDNYFIKNNEFNIQFPDLLSTLGCTEVTQETGFPIYYSNTLSRLIPVLDLFLSKIIEQNNLALLSRFLNQYKKVYIYFHDTLITSVKDLLVYYYDAPLLSSTLDSKLQFLPLIDNLMLFSINNFNNIPSLDDYFINLIGPLESIVNLHDPNVMDKILYSNPEKILSYEFPNPVEDKLNYVVLELLLIPIDDQSKVDGLLNLLNYTLVQEPYPYQKPPCSNLVLSLSMIFSLLPNALHTILLDRLSSKFIELLSNLNGFIDKEYNYNNYSTNIKENFTTPIQWYCYFLNYYFLYCPIERLPTLYTLINNLRPYIKNIQHYFTMMSIVAVLMPRYGSTPHLVQIIGLLLEILKDISLEIEVSLLEQSGFNSLSSLSSNSSIINDNSNSFNNSNNSNINNNSGNNYFNNSYNNNQNFTNNDMMMMMDDDDGGSQYQQQIDFDNNIKMFDQSLNIQRDLELFETIVDWFTHLKMTISHQPLKELIIKFSKEDLNDRPRCKAAFSS